MKHTIISILSCLFIFSIFLYSHSEEYYTDKIPDGEWVSVSDSMLTWKVKNGIIFEYYENKLLDSVKYFLTKKPCDNKYYDFLPKDALFLILYYEDWECCYALDGITDEYIEIVWTAKGGTPLTFYRKALK